MFQNYFFNQTTKKYVTMFGNIFNDITLVRYKGTLDQEIERFIVPISYAPKEKFIVRLKQNPELLKSTQITLPRMSFEKTSITYDTSRQQQRYLKTIKQNGPGDANFQYVGTPYDLTFDLNIYTRNIDDADQILEQIIPVFSPDFTVSTNLIPSLGFIKDIPIILNNITTSISDDEDLTNLRDVVYTLTFTMKAWFFGIVNNQKLIRQVFANTFIIPSSTISSLTTINLGTGSGTYPTYDVVYQGNDPDQATACGVVVNFYPANNILNLSQVSGTFLTNTVIHSSTTNANYTAASFSSGPLKVISLSVVPNPLTANSYDDYGYSISILETPNIT